MSTHTHTHTTDLFAIPDFAAGAMENWGLITYRETAVLYDPTSDPIISKRRVATVVAHELAHQVSSVTSCPLVSISLLVASL